MPAGSPCGAGSRCAGEWDDNPVMALSFVGWLVTLLVAIALVVGLVLFFATSGFWGGGGGDSPF
jgi:disulfide bond formation protein DsbB